jgi:hypothetical protein
MEKKIELRFLRSYYNLYLGIEVPEEMEASELLKIIEANELAEHHIHSGHNKINSSYRNSGKLGNRNTYDVHTNNLDKTLDLIKSFNHKSTKLIF